MTLSCNEVVAFVSVTSNIHLKNLEEIDDQKVVKNLVDACMEEHPAEL